MKLDLGNACAIRMVEAPCPQPMSATRAPRFRRSTTPPRAHQLRAIAGAEEALGAAEQAMVMGVPAQAFAGAEGFDDLVFIEPERGRDLESRRHENRALVEREHHRLRRRQCVSPLFSI